MMAHSFENKNKRNIFDGIMSIYTLIIMCVFPVVYDNFYFNILETKYRFYCIAAIAMMVVMFVYGMYTNKLIDGLKGFQIKKAAKSLTVVDWAVLAFWFANVVSWIFCKWRWEAFWGTSGRYNGVFLITIYLIVYFMTTRFFVLKRMHLDAFLLVSILVCLFGISDYFQMDLLGFKIMMLDEQKALYTSTLGNINTYTIYVAVVLCVSMILYVLENCKKRMVYYFSVMAIAMVALIVGASDNAYLSLAALFGLSPLILFHKKSWIRRYLTCVALFVTVIVFVGWINTAYAERVYGLDSIFVILSDLEFLPVVAMTLWVFVIGWGAIVAKKDNKKDEIGNGLIIAWMAMIAIIAVAVGYVLYDANLAGNAEKYDAIKNYVVFNDEWGTRRGYVWIRSVDLYSQIFTPIQQLFGYGADTFKLLMVQYYPPENGVVFDNAHNEYLHFLMTTGLVGVASYIVLLVTSVYTMFKAIKNSPEVVAIMFVVLAYAIQAIVNINLPVVFPLIWQLLAMGLCKGVEEKE